MAIQKVTSSLIADNAVGLDQLNVTDGTDGQVLKTNGSGTLSFADAAGGGGGAWNVMSSQTVSSSVLSLTFTNVTGYKVYKLLFSDVNNANNVSVHQINLSSDNGSSWATFGVASTSVRYNSNSTSTTISNGVYQANKLPFGHSYNEYDNNEKQNGEVTIFGLNDSSYTYLHSRMMSNWGWNTNYINANETYARTHGSGGLASFNAFKITIMADQNIDGGTFTLYGLANS